MMFTLLLFSRSQSHTTPPERILQSFSVDSSLVRKSELLKGQITVFDFPSPYGVALILGTDVSYVISSYSLFGGSDLGGVLSFAQFPAHLEVVALEATFVTVIAAYLGSSCGEIRTICSGSVHIPRISADEPLCLLPACGGGQFTARGSLSTATLSLISASTTEIQSDLPVEGLTCSFSDVPLIVVSSESDTILNLSLLFASDTDRDFVLTFSEDTPSGLYNGTWSSFTPISGEPNYPTMDRVKSYKSNVSTLTRLLLTLFSLFLTVAVVGVAAKCVIIAGQPRKPVRRRRHGGSRPGLVPDTGYLPSDSDEYSGEVSGRESDPEEVSTDREADNPYGAEFEVPGQQGLRT
jgi:hypothetical protein